MTWQSLHRSFCGNSDRLADWFCKKTEVLNYPIYSSYDIRDAGFKISNVDANIYPAGFNNICPTDKETSIGLMKQYLEKHYGVGVQKIFLVTEEHTNNPFYWENILTIQSLFESSGKKVMIGIPRQLESPLTVVSATGVQVAVHSAFEENKDFASFNPDLIISNNDFSNAYEDWALQVKRPLNPPRELGWYQRKKSRYFKLYNELVNEFSALAEIDPFLLNVRTEVFEGFDLSDENSRKHLAEKVDQFLAALKSEYEKRDISQTPFAFVKNNSGTYGLAVIKVESGKEVLDWSYKSRKKMKAAKGGRDVDEVIIQEGIPTVVSSEGSTAEPVVYMIGCELAGGFLRTHSEKSAIDSLNSPGAVYKKLCVSDLNVSLKGSPLENVYGWSARLGLLAIALEGQEMGVKYPGFQPSACRAKV